MTISTANTTPITPKQLGEEAMIIGENLLSVEQRNYLKKHKLRVGAVKSVNVENPRHEAKTTWVGIDRLLGEPEDQPAILAADGTEVRTIEALATRILASSGKDINDFHCSGVINEGHHLYTLVDMNTKLDFNVNGFIFISKDAITQMRSSNTHNLTKKLTDDLHTAKANEIFAWELDEYKCWIYGNVYDLAVCIDDYSGARISKTIEHCYNIENLIELEVSDAASSIIEGIDNTDGSLKITLQMDTDKVHNNYLDHIVDGLSQEFGFAFTLGSTTEDYNTGEVTLVLLPHEIPIFQELVDSSGYHLIELMRKYSVDADGKEPMGAWDLVNTLMMPQPFHAWSDVMQSALLKTLFVSIHYTKVTKIEPVGKPKEVLEFNC